MQPIELRPGLSVSPLVQGFWRLGNWGMTAQELVAFLEGCIERGVTTIDTAEIYGRSEELLGQALKLQPSLRPRLQIVTKTGISRTAEGKGYYDTRGAHVREACQGSLQRLGCEYLDIYLIHREDPCFDPYDTAEALDALQEAGDIRAAGVSNFDPFKFNALNRACKYPLVTNQIEMHPFCSEHFDSGMVDTLCMERVHPMIWSPLEGGRVFTAQDEMHVKFRAQVQPLCEKYAVELDTLLFAWLWHHPVGALPISGSSQLARLDRALQARQVQLEHADWYAIYTASGQKRLR